MLNFLRNCQNSLAVYILTGNVRGFLCVHILANTYCFGLTVLFSVTAIPVGMKWLLIVVLFVPDD